MNREGKLDPNKVRSTIDDNHNNVEQKAIKIKGENYDQYVAIKHYNQTTLLEVSAFIL